MKQIYTLCRSALVLGGLAMVIQAVLLISCSDMNDLHQPYLDRGEITYAARIDSVTARTGRNRIQFDLINQSQRIKSVRIFWNDYRPAGSDVVKFRDSTDVDITGKGIFKKMLEGLDERSYTFRLVSVDEFGNYSLPLDIHAFVYGARYQTQLVARSMRSAYVNMNGDLRIEWGIADGAYASAVKFTNVGGEVVTRLFPINEPVSVVEGFNGNAPFEFSTVYKPDTTSIDAFYTDYVKVDPPFMLYQKDWKVIDFSTEHDDGTNGVKNFIDGTDATRWHSKAGASSYPHFATIDMGGVRTITQFSLWITTFENPGGDHRAPDKVQFLVSLDNISWTDMGEFDMDRFYVGEQKYPMPPSTQARYFKFVGVSGPENNMVMGEISAYGF